MIIDEANASRTSWFSSAANFESANGPEDAEASNWQSTPADEAGIDRKRQGAESFQRTYRAFLSARALLALLLLALLAGNWLMGYRGMLWILTAVCYAAGALMAWAWPSVLAHQSTEHPSVTPALTARQATFSIGLDLVFFSFLQHTTSNNFNSEALLALPVLMAGVLVPRPIALGVAAAASLNLLAAAWIQGQLNTNLGTSLTQAGLTGFGLFAIATLASELAARVAREELTARGNLELARQQARLNRLVMEEMAEGVMVIDRQGLIRTANPAARRLLALQNHSQADSRPLSNNGIWRALAHAVEESAHSPWQAETGQEIRMQLDDGSSRDLHVRVRFTRGHTDLQTEDMCMVWLEDSRQVRARHRQDKLAAMGRMSAGIAHEIRNPLAAISQANALLAEDARTPTQHRLSRMIADNVARIQHTVEDILAVSPGSRSPASPIDLLAGVQRYCEEWRVIHGLRDGEASLLEIETQNLQSASPPIRVRFEPDHLQRVLVNLLDNGLRHGSGQPGSIRLTVHQLRSRSAHDVIRLSISSDGQPLSSERERSLFEPFYSTRSRGTGLGLYICKELCERHGAVIDYKQHPPGVRHCNEFFISIPIEPEGVAPPTA